MWDKTEGRRVLIVNGNKIREARILELSPSGKYAKIRYLDDMITVDMWVRCEDCELLEFLDEG